VGEGKRRSVEGEGAKEVDMGWGDVGCLYLNGGDPFEPEMTPPSFTQYCTSISSEDMFPPEIFSLADGGSTEEVWTRPDVQGTSVGGSKPLYVLIKGTISGYQRRRRVYIILFVNRVRKIVLGTSSLRLRH
jgi:hypothetical protein